MISVNTLIRKFLLLFLIIPCAGLSGCASKWILENYGGKQQIISGDPDKIFVNGNTIYMGANEYLESKKQREGYVRFPVRRLYPQDIGYGRDGIKNIEKLIEGPIPQGSVQVIKGKTCWNGQGYTGPPYYLDCVTSFDVVLLQPSMPGGCNGPNNISKRKLSVQREWYRSFDTGLLLMLSMPLNIVGLLFGGLAYH